MDEKIDVLDGAGDRTGRVAWKSEAHRAGLWHGCFHCWISAPGTPSGGPYLFVQRRAPGKETWPGRLDVTAAGHLGAGEEPLDGRREIEEELGLRVASDELIPLGIRRSELEIPAGIDREFQHVFLLVKPLAPEDLPLQREEVAAVARLRLGDVEPLYGGAAEVEAEEWTGGERRPVTVRLADFVPGEDGYLSKVARAVRAALAGEPPGRIF